MLIPLLLVANIVAAYAQLNGTYTIGGSSANYTSITAAIDALNTSGVSGPVTFTLASGIYAPPTSGWQLRAVTGMSAVNCVTFRPAAGATVLIKGQITSFNAGIFNIVGGRYYVIDGSNSGGTSKDMTVVLYGSDDAATVWMKDGASYNIVKNCRLQATSGFGGGVVVIGSNNAVARNDSNAVLNCLIGDPDGIYRGPRGITVTAWSSGTADVGTKIIGNEIINVDDSLGMEPASIFLDNYAIGTIIDHNVIHQTRATSASTISAIRIWNTRASTINTRITGNTIYAIVGKEGSSTQVTTYGIYVWDQLATLSSTLIANNMISIEARDGSLNYGLYIRQPQVGNRDSIFALHNSITVIDGGAGTSTTRMLVRDGTVSNGNLTVLDNVLYSPMLTENDTVYALYLPKVDGLVCDYNLLEVGSGAGSNISYVVSAAYRTLAQHRSSTSFDVHSVRGNPKFIVPARGDLHVSTSRRTPVSGQGISNFRVSVDIDGDLRASSPDLGADEGSFLDLLANDMGIDAAETPVDGGKYRAGTAFTPSVVVENIGTATQSNVPVRFRIIEASTGAVVYNDLRTIGAIAGGERKRVTFGQSGSVQGTTSLQPGSYVAIVRTEMTSPVDQDAFNDSVHVTFVAGAPLAGTYSIDSSGSGSRNFSSIGLAIGDLLSFGVADGQGDSAVTFLLAGGRYDRSRESFPIRIGAFVGGSGAHPVTFRPAPDASVVIQAQTGEAAVDLVGCSYVRLDGRSGAGNDDAAWKVVNMGSGPALSFSRDAAYCAVRNLTLQAGAMSVPDGAVVAFETPSQAIGNHHDTVMACTIGDTSGVIRSLSGIVGFSGEGEIGTGGSRDIAILDNDILNFGIPLGDVFTVQSYGIFVTSGARWNIDGNRIHDSSPAGSDPEMYVGIFCNQTAGVTISANQIFDIRGLEALSEACGIGLVACGTSMVHDNLIAVSSGAWRTTLEANGVYWYPLNGDTLKFYHNTVDMKETNLRSGYCLNLASPYATLVGLVGFYGSGVVDACAQVYNNIFTSEASGGAAIYRGEFFSTIQSDFNLLYAPANTTALVESDFNTTSLTSRYKFIPEWTERSGQDAHSISGRVIYRDADAGDLHIDTALVFPGESAAASVAVLGSPYPYPSDVDHTRRDTLMPDMGGDEGDYNGGGLRLITPNGGEEYPVDYMLDVTFTANRPMDVHLEISTDDGATWSVSTPSVHIAQAGPAKVTILTPDVVVNTARVRVISQRNHWEADTSDRAFSLVRPRFTVLQPNGGEIFVPTDTIALRWTNEFMLPDFKAELNYSIDGGATWSAIVSGLDVVNLPDTNAFDWVIPDTPTTRAKVRAKLVGSHIADGSDTTFTILSKPVVELKTPNGDRDLYVGEQIVIRWSSVTTDNIRLEYTIDGGRSWLPITTTSVPAETGSFAWRVPDTPSDSVFVRVVNVERPRFLDASNRIFSIKHARIAVLSPNGGEAYELSQPIVVSWRQNDVDSLNIEYSSDYGTTWKALATSVPAAAGSYSITPLPVPTRLALVRLIDAAHDWVSDYSDRPFRIMPPKGIVIFTPAVGDELIRRSTYVINWRAERVDTVDLFYSLDNGATWNTIANGVPAGQGSHVWSVPNQLTNQGLIRIIESHGSAFAERSYFRIIDAKQPVVKVIKPNGGERYTSGDDVVIQWSATSDITFVSLSYSSDDGATWNPIVANLAAFAGQYTWKNTLPAGTRYRIKADGIAAADISDGPFAVTAKAVPAIRVIGPNGGEVFTVDAAAQVIWTATDVSGQVLVDYSTDDGVTWSPIGAAAASAGVIAWTIPSSVTDKGRVRVAAADNSAQDASDDRFTIKAKLLEPLRVVTPNTGAEIWTSGERRSIVWQAPADVAQVKVSFSLDGGTTWSGIATVTSLSGTNTWQWTVPIVAAETRQALIKVEDASDASRSDVSDNPFTIRSGVTTGVALHAETGSALAILGMTPNPGHDVTTVRWSQPTAGVSFVRMTDELGRVIRDERVDVAAPGEQARMLNLAGLAGGVYYVTIEHGRSKAHATLVIVR